MPDDVTDLAALEAAATPGPWDVDALNNLTGANWGHIGEIDSEADAALIVAMRNALPDLLAIAESERQLRKRAEEKVARIRESARSLVDALVEERDALRAKLERVRGLASVAQCTCGGVAALCTEVTNILDEGAP